MPACTKLSHNGAEPGKRRAMDWYRGVGLGKSPLVLFLRASPSCNRSRSWKRLSKSDGIIKSESDLKKRPTKVEHFCYSCHKAQGVRLHYVKPFTSACIKGTRTQKESFDGRPRCNHLVLRYCSSSYCSVCTVLCFNFLTRENDRASLYPV